MADTPYTSTGVTQGNGENNVTYVSDETTAPKFGRTTVLTTKLSAEGAPAASPLHILNQKKCSVQFRLTDFNKGTNDKSKTAVFNITWPQAQAVYKKAEKCIVDEAGHDHWDLADKWNHTNELERVFGNPIPPVELNKKFPGMFKTPSEATGYCPARILILRRDSTRRDGSPSNYPWYIEIRNGYAKKITTQQGGSYMERKSFVEESGVHMNVTDGDMMDMLYWDKAGIGIIIRSAASSFVKAFIATINRGFNR